MKAFFRRSLVLTYAFPKKILEPLLDPGLSLDDYQGNAFIALALVETRQLRPNPLPAWLGRNFFLIGFRVFVKFSTREGKTLRGLKILQSLTDSSLMAKLGNIFTAYQWKKSHIVSQDLPGKIWEIRCSSARHNDELQLRADLSGKSAELPPESPFPDFKTARKFAGPLPHTFSFEKDSQKVLVVQGRRQAWDPQPVHVEILQNRFFDKAPFQNSTPRLANAFFLENIPYHWEAGKLMVPLRHE